MCVGSLCVSLCPCSRVTVWVGGCHHSLMFEGSNKGRTLLFSHFLSCPSSLAWSVLYNYSHEVSSAFCLCDLKEMGLANDKMCSLTLEQNFCIILMGFIVSGTVLNKTLRRKKKCFSSLSTNKRLLNSVWYRRQWTVTSHVPFLHRVNLKNHPIPPAFTLQEV